MIFTAQLAFAFWVGMLLACLYLVAWDIDHIYEIFLRLLFFMTPILYTWEFLGDRLAQNGRLNPLARMIEYTRGRYSRAAACLARSRRRVGDQCRGLVVCLPRVQEARTYIRRTCLSLSVESPYSA